MCSVNITAFLKWTQPQDMTLSKVYMCVCVYVCIYTVCVCVYVYVYIYIYIYIYCSTEYADWLYQTRKTISMGHTGVRLIWLRAKWVPYDIEKISPIFNRQQYIHIAENIINIFLVICICVCVRACVVIRMKAVDLIVVSWW